MTIFERIKNKASQALQTAGNFVDRDQSMSGVQLAQGGLSNRVQNVAANIGRTLQKAPDTTFNYQQPDRQLFGVGGPQGFNAVPFLTSLPGEMVRSYGKTLERISTPQGRQEIGQGTKDLFTQVPSLDTLNNPAVQTAFDVTDFLPGAGLFFGGLKSVAKEGAEKVAREGAEMIARDGAETIANNVIQKPPRGLITRTENEIDNILGTDSFMFGNSWRNRLPARGTALDQLQSYADTGDVLPNNTLNLVNNRMELLDRVRSGDLFNIDGNILPNGEVLPPPKPAVPEEVINSLPLRDILDSSKPTILSGDPAIKLPKRPSDTMYVTPQGTTFKVNKQPKTTQSFDSVLDDASQAINPADKTIVETKALPAPKNVPLLNDLNGRPEMPKFSQMMPEPDVLEETAKVAKQGLRTSKSGTTKFFDSVVKPSISVIEKSGPSGKQAATLIRNSEEQGARLAGDWLDGMKKAIDTLSGEERASLADVIEGKLAPTSQAQQNAANTWRYIANDIHRRGTEAGLELGKISNYFPHIPDEKMLTTEMKDQIRLTLSRSGQRRYGNLELPRELNAPYLKNPEVLLDYIDKAARRVTDAQNFGAADEKLYDLAKKAGFEGGDTLQLNSYMDQILGKNQDPMAELVSKNLRSVQQFKLNPITSLKNLTQNISTLVRTDPQSVGSAINRIVSDPEKAKSILVRSGEGGIEFDEALKEITGSSGKYVKGIGMQASEQTNRLIAVNSGYSYAEKLAGQFKKGSESASRELQRLGFSLDEIENGLRESDFITAGRRVSQETQFSTKAGELPFGWKTPTGKVLTQFKPFGYKQTGFVFGKLLPRVTQEVAKGNFKPLVSLIVGYGIAAPAAGEIINTVKSLFTNKERTDTGSLKDRYISDTLSGFSLGLVDTLPALTGEFGAKGVISSILGPTSSTVLDAGETIANVPAYLGGDEYAGRKASRNVLKQIPVVGNTISNTVVPNSYVDNVFGGVNEGMNEKDTTTYKNLLKSDPKRAELFKDGKIKERDSEPGLLEKMFAPKKTQPISIGTTPEEKKAFDSQVRDMLDAGGVPDKATLKQFSTKGKNPSSKSIEERTKAYSSVKTLVDNELYSDEQKQAILEASGIEKDSFDYYSLASKDADVRLQELLPKLDNMDSGKVVEFLMQGRKAIAGKQLVSSEMVDYLFENDYIGQNEKEAIKALKFDEIKNEFYFSKSFAKKGTGMTYKQAKALYKMDMPKFSTLKNTSSLLGSYNNASQTGRGNDKLISNILNSPKKQKNGKLWF